MSHFRYIFLVLDIFSPVELRIELGLLPIDLQPIIDPIEFECGHLQLQVLPHPDPLSNRERILELLINALQTHNGFLF
jgi:hypothetical protein